MMEGMDMKSNYYIDPVELKEEVVKTQQQNRCTDRLAQMLQLLHQKILNMKSFRGYRKEDKEDMMMWSLERYLSKGLYTAKPECNLFSYFTTGIYRNYQNWIMRMYKRKEKEKKYIRSQLMKQSNDMSTINELVRKWEVYNYGK